MKRRFTILTAALALLAILAIPMGVWGQTRAEVVSYTLDGTQTGGTNGYATESEITQGDITWMVTGNTTMNPWRIGGKNLNSVDRPLYSTSTIADNITKVVVTNGTANLTVNSMTLMVSANADFSNPTSTVSGTWAASSTTTFERPTGADWTNMYFKLIYNVTAGSSNQYAQFVQADFYMEEGSGPSVATPTFTPASGAEFGDEGLSVEISCATENTTIYYTLDGSEPDDESMEYTGAISLTETTTIKAIAFDSDDNTSAVATAIYTYVDPNQPGTQANPYTVAQARAAIDANTGTQGVYAMGIVSAIPTAYSTQYSNITFNMVDEAGDEVFLQAYRCGGNLASEVAVGDVAVVYGNLTKYGSTYEFGQGCQVVSLTHPSILAPAFSIAAGGYAEAQSVELSCETPNAVIYYTLDGSDPTNASTQYNNSAISITETTTIKAIAYVGTANSPVAEAAYYILSSDNVYTVTEALAFGSYPQNNIFVSGIVSTASESLISGAQLTYYISVDGEAANELEVYKGRGMNDAAFTSVDDIQVGDIVTVFGNVQEYQGTIEFGSGNYLITFERPAAPVVPTVTVANATVSFPAEGGEGTLTVTYENITEVVAEVYFCDANGESATYEWITAEINEDNNVEYLVEPNEGEARTAYFKVYALDDNVEEVYSNLVTVNQAEYVAPVLDYAELPFEFDGGRADIANTNGLTQDGLDSDYSSSPKLKFNSTGDWLMLHFNERPGTLTFNIKGNGFSGGTFTVQTSEDGETYTDLATYTSLGSSIESEEFTNLGENVRYIKWIYTEKSSGNVALGNIALAEYTEPVLVASITVDPDEVNVDANPAEGEDFIEGTLDLTWENLEITDIWEDFAIQYYDAEGEELTDDPDWIVVEFATQDPSIGEGYLVSYMVDVNEGEARTAYFKVFALGEEDYVYSNLVTITQAAPVVPPTPGNWVLTNIADLTVDDIFVIVGDNGNTYAMSNDNGFDEAPAAVPVTVVDNTLSGDIAENIQWNISGSASSGYMFYPNGSDIEFLFCNNANNGLRVGGGEDDEDALFNITDDYLYNIGQERYIGIYNNQDWRCYTSINNNIKNQTFAFYKKVETHTLDITGYGDSTNGGYCLIASPVTVNPENVEGMTDGNFDLYRFNQSAESEWENWKKQGDHYHFNLVPGKGYLYAKKATTETPSYSFTLTGTPYNGNGVVELDYTEGEGIDFAGWNLIGNPYAVNAYLVGDPDFYTMNADGTEFVIIDAEAARHIQAMEGVFFVATAPNQSVTFTTTAPSKMGSRLGLNLSNGSKVIDRAIVRFDECSQLPKFQLNKNHTKIYIPQDGQDYAVVRSEEMGEMPVCFKAENNGSYTLSFSSQNTEFAYLHLIDNMTGADIDMLQTSSYSFEAKTTDYANRFKLVYATGDNSNDNNFAFFSNGSFVINNEGDATLQVVDVTGRIVKSESINGCTNVNVNAAPGVYMLRLVNGDNMKIQKVVVK